MGVLGEIDRLLDSPPLKIRVTGAGTEAGQTLEFDEVVLAPRSVLRDVKAALGPRPPAQYTNDAETVREVVRRIGQVDGESFDSCVLPWEQCVQLAAYINTLEVAARGND